MKELFERYYSLNKTNEITSSQTQKSSKISSESNASNKSNMQSGSSMSDTYKMPAGTKTSDASSKSDLTGKIDTPEEEAMCMDWLRTQIGLANAYVPFQEDFIVMSEENSLACGTVFPQLAMPYRKGSKI